MEHGTQSVDLEIFFSVNKEDIKKVQIQGEHEETLP